MAFFYNSAAHPNREFLKIEIADSRSGTGLISELKTSENKDKRSSVGVGKDIEQNGIVILLHEMYKIDTEK